MSISKLELFVSRLKVKSTSTRNVVNKAPKIYVTPTAAPVYVMDHSSASPRSIEQLYYGDTWQPSVPFKKPNRQKLASMYAKSEY